MSTNTILKHNMNLENNWNIKIVHTNTRAIFFPIPNFILFSMLLMLCRTYIKNQYTHKRSRVMKSTYIYHYNSSAWRN